jgi:threonine dehydrogenase-like Zn-dependent dehydrogenase
VHESDDVERDLLALARQLTASIWHPDVLRLRSLVIGEAGRFPHLGEAYFTQGPVGGNLRTTSLDVMAPLGRLLAVGNASGDWQHQVDTNRLWVSNLAILGFSGGSYLPTHPQLARPAAEGALKAISAGLVNVHTDVLPLEQAPEAHRQIEAGHVNGRMLLAP